MSFTIDLGGSSVTYQGAIGIRSSAIERDGQVYCFMPEAGFLHLDGIFHGGRHGQGVHRGTNAEAEPVCFVLATSEEQKSYIIVSYAYLASTILYSIDVIFSQCTYIHVV